MVREKESVATRNAKAAVDRENTLLKKIIKDLDKQKTKDSTHLNAKMSSLKDEVHRLEKEKKKNELDRFVFDIEYGYGEEVTINRLRSAEIEAEMRQRLSDYRWQRHYTDWDSHLSCNISKTMKPAIYRLRRGAKDQEAFKGASVSHRPTNQYFGPKTDIVADLVDKMKTKHQTDYRDPRLCQSLLDMRDGYRSSARLSVSDLNVPNDKPEFTVTSRRRRGHGDSIVAQIQGKEEQTPQFAARMKFAKAARPSLLEKYQALYEAEDALHERLERTGHIPEVPTLPSIVDKMNTHVVNDITSTVKARLAQSTTEFLDWKKATDTVETHQAVDQEEALRTRYLRINKSALGQTLEQLRQRGVQDPEGLPLEYDNSNIILRLPSITRKD